MDQRLGRTVRQALPRSELYFPPRVHSGMIYPMRSRVCRPCALTIAGSDSGGGAGVQADLKTFAALGVHGTSVLTCLTAQNPSGVLGVFPVPLAMVALQLRAVVEGFDPQAVKTGMLYSTGILGVIGEWLREHPKVSCVVDPVMVATSGARLLRPSAVRVLEQKVLPHAAIMTPNRDEAEVLAGIEIRDVRGLKRAAALLRSRFGCPVLVKGGHLEGDQAVDVFFDGREECTLTAARIHGVSSHGTGCTYSAAIAAHLAHGCALLDSVRKAKRYITRAIGRSIRVHGHDVLQHG